jgi:hypothetical protein
MTTKFLALAALAALLWAVIQAAPEPVSRSLELRPTMSDAGVVVDSQLAGPSSVLQAHQAPVPLVRSARALPLLPTVVSPEAAAPAADAPAQDSLDRTAAKAAIEADGYKRVNVVGKGTGGTWRAKAYRGTTEVQLTVDGTGRVSAD